MHDQPTAAELLEVVAEFIRDEAAPQLSGHAAFTARVAANALDIVRRELELSPAADAREHERLCSLLGETGDLETLNRRLCERIARGELGLRSPGLVEHLWSVTLAKLAVDQPGYSTYRRLMAPSPTKEGA